MDRCFRSAPFRVLGSAVDYYATEWCGCRSSRGGLNHTTGVEHVAPLPIWKTNRPVLELERYPADPAYHVSSGAPQEGPRTPSPVQLWGIVPPSQVS